MTIIHPLRNPKLKTKVLPEGNVVVYDEATAWAHVLSPLGAIIWELCDGTNDWEKLCSELSSIGGDKLPSGYVDDARQFLQALEGDGMIVEGP